MYGLPALGAYRLRAIYMVLPGLPQADHDGASLDSVPEEAQALYINARARANARASPKITWGFTSRRGAGRVPSMPLDPSKRDLPVQDLWMREPEWEPLERGAADQGEGRQFMWDPIHGWVSHTGPIVQVTVPPNRLRPY